jgi:hypothetical protein
MVSFADKAKTLSAYWPQITQIDTDSFLTARRLLAYPDISNG